ncbi:uncharacterized protein [Clinocottus analis]|uniref:uncharacterized protein isoform X2 n=1 Tax=Clinocottus analis TaxID=304258 RepID=UPI0035C08D43
MMIALLLLAAFVGLSGGRHEVKVYGDTHYIHITKKPEFIEFSPKDTSNVTTLWKRGDRHVIFDRKYIMMRSYFSISHLTQQDSGRYIMRDEDQMELSTNTLEVKAITTAYKKRTGDTVRLSFNLKPNSCNIYFFPKSDRQPKKLKNEIVREGRLQESLDELDCVGFDRINPCGISNQALQMSCNGRYEIRDQNDNTAFMVSLEMEQITKTIKLNAGDRLEFTLNLEPNSCNIYFFPESDGQTGDFKIKIVHQGRLDGRYDDVDCVAFYLLEPCGISKEDLQMSCNGRYEIRDQNDDTALVVSLEMKSIPYEPSRIGIGVGVFLSSLFCYCLKCCCCGKSKSKEDRSDTAAAEPDAQYQVYDSEPVGARSDQLIPPSETPAQSYTLAGPLVHDYPSVNLPPPYSEVHDHPSVNLPPAYSQVSASAEQPDAPTVPVSSDLEPRFEMKGMTFPTAPLLSSDSTHCDVYTSEKLNFL